METVSDPTCVHVAPLVELEAAIVLPLRTSRTQTGAPDAPPAVCALTPPVADPPVESEAIPRRQRHEGVSGAGRKRLADHASCLGPGVSILNRCNTSHYLAVSVQRLVDELETVGVPPDICA